MTMKTMIFVTLSVFVAILSGVAGQSVFVMRLLRDPDKYDKQLLPIKNTDAEIFYSPLLPRKNETVIVKTQIIIRSIVIDDINMLGTVEMTLRLWWHEKRIYFNDTTKPYITLASAQEVWLPDLFFRGSRKVEQQKTLRKDNYLRIFINETFLYSTRLMVTLPFPMNLQLFPHDRQDFSIQLASYAYDESELMFTWHEQPVSLSKTLYISSFSLSKFETHNCRTKTNTGIYSCLGVMMLFYRNFGSYLKKWYIPVIFLVITTFFSELVPSSNLCGRLSLVLLPILIFCINNWIFSLTMASVNYTTAMDIFGGISMTVMFVMMVRVLISHYLVTKKQEKDSYDKLPKETERPGNMPKRVWEWVYPKSDIVFRVAIFGFYTAFVIIYFIKYSNY